MKKEIEAQMKVAIQERDREAEDVMREERDRCTKMIQKVESDTGSLRSNMNSLLAERDKRVAKMEQNMKKQQAAHSAGPKKINDRQQRIEKEKVELEKQQRQRERKKRSGREKEQERKEKQRPRKEREKRERNKNTGRLKGRVRSRLRRKRRPLLRIACH